MTLPNPTATDLSVFYLKLRRLGESPRFWDLHRAEAVWKGLQYRDRPDWTDDSYPLTERAPCVAYPIARSAGLRLVSFVFGEGRFPTITMGNGGSELQGLDLSPADAATLTTGVNNVTAAARLKLGMRDGLEMGLACGTACAVISLRSSKLKVDWIWAKWCTPTFDPHDEDRVIRLVVRYQHEGATGPVWYRRVVDDASDTVWDNVPVDENGYEPDWMRWDPVSTQGLEFCPVVWIRNLPDPGAIGDIDGRALFEGLEDEIEAIDRSLSQRDRNALLNGDPLTVITGASRSDIEGEQGRAAQKATDVPSWFNRTRQVLSKAQSAANSLLGSSGNSAIKKGAGSLIAINKEGGSAELLETSGAGATVLTNHANDLRAKLLETVGVVLMDPEKAASGELAAATLRQLYAPMLALCDNLRECWGDGMVRVIGMCLRMLTSGAARDAYGRTCVRGIANADNLVGVLRFFNRPMADGSTAWFCPPLSLEWGEYFEPSWGEKLAAAQAATAILAEGILTKRTVIQAIAPIWGVEDVEGEIAETDASEAKSSQAASNLLSHVMRNGPPQAQTPQTAAQPVEKP